MAQRRRWTSSCDEDRGAAAGVAALTFGSRVEFARSESGRAPQRAPRAAATQPRGVRTGVRAGWGGLTVRSAILSHILRRPAAAAALAGLCFALAAPRAAAAAAVLPIPSRELWVPTGVVLATGERASVSATGEWTDWYARARARAFARVHVRSSCMRARTSTGDALTHSTRHDPLAACSLGTSRVTRAATRGPPLSAPSKGCAAARPPRCGSS